MFFIKINAFVLTKEKLKEKDGIVYILSKNYGILKCYTKGLFRPESKNLSSIEPLNFNRFFILTNLEKFKIISSLILKDNHYIFKKSSYQLFWLSKLIKKFNLFETPKNIWNILINLDKMINQNKKNFSYWFVYHLLKELGFEIDLERCYNCQKKINKVAYFDNKKFLYCINCKKEPYSKIDSTELFLAKDIKKINKIPLYLPKFLKKILKNSLSL